MKVWHFLILIPLLFSATAVFGESCNQGDPPKGCGQGPHSSGTSSCEETAYGYEWGACNARCDTGYALDDYGFCAPPPSAGCLIPGNGNVSGLYPVLDRRTGERMTVGAYQFSEWCSEEDLKKWGGGGGDTSAVKPVSTASAVNNTSSEEDAKKIQETASKNSGNQSEARSGSLEVINLAANQSASAGAIFCASSAVEVDDHPDQSAQEWRQCRQNFAAANEMQGMGEKLGKKGGFAVDPAVAETEGAKGILGRFQQKYGISGEDYLHRMLGSRGDPKTLEELTGGKLSAEKFKDLADNTKPGEESQLAVKTAAMPLPKNEALRDALRKQLGQQGKAASTLPRIEKPDMNLGRHVASEELKPLENPFDDLKEISLFEVVHRKYRQKAKMLVPYRFK